MKRQIGTWLAAGLLALSFSSGARAMLPKRYTQVSTLLMDTWDPRSIAVNTNRYSPYYGYVYVADTAANAIRIFRPSEPGLGANANGLVDTGKRIRSTSSSYSPAAVTVAEDDTVWCVGEYEFNVDVAPPVPPEGDEVTATRFFAAESFGYHPSALRVRGTVANATVYMRSGTKVALFTGSAESWTEPGEFTRQWVATATPGYPGGTGMAIDRQGNAYIDLTHDFDHEERTLIARIRRDGTVDEDFTVAAPAFASRPPTGGDLSILESPNGAGVGYLFYDAVDSSSTNGASDYRRIACYRLDNGQYIDGFGPAPSEGYAAPADASYTVLQAGADSYRAASTIDDNGSLYIVGRVPQSITKVRVSQPFAVAPGALKSAGGAVQSSPTAVDGVVYFGSDDARLYAYSTEDGNPVPGFPVAMAGMLKGRPAVYTIDGVKRIYFTTSAGLLARVNADGTGLTTAPISPFMVNTMAATPAVMPDGSVLLAGDGIMGVTIYQFDANLVLKRSQSMSSGIPFGTTISSVAVAGGKAYVAAGGVTNGVWVFNAQDLTPVASSLPAGEGSSAPPYVVDGSMFIGTDRGNFYKINAVTGVPDPTFGAQNATPTPGRAALMDPIRTSPFYRNGYFFVGTAAGRVFAVDAETGSFSLHYDIGDQAAAINGIAMSPWGDTLAFGASNGRFYTMPRWRGGAVSEFRGYPAFSTTPTFDFATMSFFVGNLDGNVYKMPYDPPAN